MTQNNARVVALRTKFQQARAELQEALAESARGDVADYEFATLNGPVKLSAMFGAKRDLFVIHNMGRGCNSCTMWADGFNGLYPHIANRASFVVSNHETPEQQAEFAASRGWKFPMVSTQGNSFAADMGFTNAAGKPMPGVSAFQMLDGKIVRVSASGFNDADEFCPVWRLLDLLPEGPDGWRPQRSYDVA
ncbi:MAG TPA: DUF899 family protein [Hyphomonadaceae bacterium]|nr:DUF899 family protein [Hyphomonadaceae bacterium]